jgi:predicted DNA-binding ribbon-helix-helix protein
MAPVLTRGSNGSRRPSPSALAIRNIVVAGRRTSVRLEALMWDSLRDIARQRGASVADLVTEIDGGRNGLSLTAAIRVYIVDFYRNAAANGSNVVTVTLPM